MPKGWREGVDQGRIIFLSDRSAAGKAHYFRACASAQAAGRSIDKNAHVNSFCIQVGKQKKWLN